MHIYDVDMRSHQVRSKRVMFVGALAVVLFGALSACSAVDRVAVRLNSNGTLDFASCNAVRNVTKVEAATTKRTGPNGQVDDRTAVALKLEMPVKNLAVGQVISFSGVPAKWDRLDIEVEGDSWATAPTERNSLTVGQWTWNDEGPFTSYNPSNKCAIGIKPHH